MLASEAQLRAIARLRDLGGYRLRPGGSARLQSIYIDSADLVLARHRVALRLRRHSGRWELTVKWAGRVRDVVHARPELNVPLSTPPRFPYRLDRRLPTDIAALVAGKALSPILITQIHRRLLDVLPSTGRGKPLAELALDRVHLRAPDGQGVATRYCEVEIEQRHGTRSDITRMARALQRRFLLVPSRESKFSRGLAALYGARLPALTSPAAERIKGPLCKA